MLDTVAAVLATPPDGFPLRWRDVTDALITLGFAPRFPRSRWLQLQHFDANDLPLWSIVELDEDLWVFTTDGPDPDHVTIAELVTDVRRFDAGRSPKYRADLTVREEIDRDAKIAEALRTLRGEAA